MIPGYSHLLPVLPTCLFKVYPYIILLQFLSLPSQCPEVPTTKFFIHFSSPLRATCTACLSLLGFTILQGGLCFKTEFSISVSYEPRQKSENIMRNGNIPNGLDFCKSELCYGGKIQSLAEDNFQNCQLRIRRFLPHSLRLVSSL